MPCRPLIRSALAAFSIAAWSAAALAQGPAPANQKPTKAELVARLVQLQQGQVQVAARTIVEQPAMQLLQQAATLVQQRVPADQREATMKDIQAEARKYVDDVSPIMRDAVQRVAAPTLAPIFEEKFNEDELRQLIAVFESPALRKYEQIAGDIQRSLREKLLAEVRGRFEERFRGLDAAVGRRLGLPPPAAAASAPRKP